MRFILTINAKKLKQTLLIVTSALIAAAIAFMHQQQLTVFTTAEKTPQAIASVDTEQNQLALTFDLDAGEIQIEPILKTLKETGVQATFFLSGSWASEHPNLTRKISRTNNELASLGSGHGDFRSKKPKQIKTDIGRARKAIKKAGGQHPALVRPPGGYFNQDILQVATDAHLTVIHWSVDATQETNAAAITKHVISGASRGDIIHLNAGGDTKQTQKALPAIIDQLQDEDYTFVTVSQLIADADTKSRLVH